MSHKLTTEKVNVKVHIDKDVADKLKKLASDEYRSVNNIIRIAIDRYLTDRGM